MQNEFKKREIIIDGLNAFVKFYQVNPACNSSGNFTGGVVGFLKFLDQMMDLCSPHKIYVVWEPAGPSSKRKAIFPEYKANREKIKGLDETINKKQRDDKLFQPENKNSQLLWLTEILKTLAICQIYLPNSECDDIIGYLAKTKLSDKSIQKVVVSSDKDFYQLLTNEDIIIYDISKKNYVTSKDVKERFNIWPHNFVLARTLDGDVSDNIPGVKGVGLKNLIKYIPEFCDEEKELDIAYLVEYCRKKVYDEKSKLKTYKTIFDNEEVIRRNWKLMYLGLNTLDAMQTTKINKIVDDFKPKYDHLSFLKLIRKYEISLNFDINLFASKMKMYLLNNDNS